KQDGETKCLGERVFSGVGGYQVGNVKSERLPAEPCARGQILSVALICGFEKIAEPRCKDILIPVLNTHRCSDLMHLLGESARGIGKRTEHSPKQRLILIDGRHKQLVEVEQESHAVMTIKRCGKRAPQPEICWKEVLIAVV